MAAEPQHISGVCPELLLKMLNESRKTGAHCDVKLVVGEKSFFAHRYVLAAVSPYFDAAFSENFSEEQNSPYTIVMDDIDESVMEAVLDYVYSNELHIPEDNLRDFLHAAHYLQLAVLIQCCLKLMEKTVNMDNCFELYNLAEAYSGTRLKRRVERFMARNFTSVSLELGFLQADHSLLISLIGQDSLNVETDDVVIDAVIRWLKYSEAARAKAVNEVLKLAQARKRKNRLAASQQPGTSSSVQQGQNSQIEIQTPGVGVLTRMDRKKKRRKYTQI